MARDPAGRFVPDESATYRFRVTDRFARHGNYRFVVRDATPDPTTGTIAVALEGNPDRLLDFAFRAVIVAEVGVMTLEQLAN